MEIKLCYKSYPVEITLGSMKKFHEATKLDMWTLLLKLINENELSKQQGSTVLQRMISFSELIPFEDGAQLLYSIIDKSLNIPLDEVRDAMFRVGWLPTERKGDKGEPYTYVLLNLAYEFNEQLMADEEPKKKADTKPRS